MYSEITPQSVDRILRDYHVIVERAYKGDIDAIAIVDELNEAIRCARLSERQARVLKLVYFDGLTQREVARLLGCSQKAVSHLLRETRKRISECLQQEVLR